MQSEGKDSSRDCNCQKTGAFLEAVTSSPSVFLWKSWLKRAKMQTIDLNEK